MIISRTPLRISFFGGGTDYPQWFNEYGGTALGTSIDKYCYVMMHDGRSWKTFDLPTKSGLGSSSAYTVGLLRVCTESDRQTIAKLATTWEQDKTGGKVGSQDQYLCAVGGFHLLKFSEHGIKDTIVNSEIVSPLQDYLMLFDTGQYRLAGDVVAEQLERMKKNRKLLMRIMEMPNEGIRCINLSDWIAFGTLLNEAWLIKRQLSKHISTDMIDDIHKSAMRAGAMGGKLLGAGGGGFILFCVEPEKQASVRFALRELTYVPFKFETKGTEVIYHD